MSVSLAALEARVAQEEQREPSPYLSLHGLTPPNWATQKDADDFAAWVASFRWRPWDWVQVCYPWGESGGDLEFSTPELWQREELMELQEKLQELIARHPEQTDAQITWKEVIRFSTASGHGVGKTALVSWVIHWFMSVFNDCEAVITASTQTQLSAKTWRELAVWQARAINGWAFKHEATTYKCIGAEKTWYATAQNWSEANPQAFAGTHGKYVLVLFDEASGIEAIWETIEGALTTGLVLFMVFGNPSEASGGFHDTHHKHRKRWVTRVVDAREVTFANHKQINEWIEDHGIDSDFVRIRVRGLFPKQSAASFISQEIVDGAVNRTVEWKYIPTTIPLLLGCDVARGGGDQCVAILRRGRRVADKIYNFQSNDLMQVAAFFSRIINEVQPQIVFVDETGVGAGVVDRLIQLGHKNIIGVMTGSRSTMPDREAKIHANLRSLIWERMREWLKSGDIPAKATQLASDLVTPGFHHERKTQRQLIESKEDIKGRGLPSPDYADALALTFAEVVANNPGGGGGSHEPDVV